MILDGALLSLADGLHDIPGVDVFEHDHPSAATHVEGAPLVLTDRSRRRLLKQDFISVLHGRNGWLDRLV